MSVAPAASRSQVLADIPLAIDPDEVLRFQGYQRGIDVPGPEVRALFEEAHALGRRLMQPRAVVRWSSLSEAADDRLVLTDGLAFTIPGIAGTWGAVGEVAGAVVTIGGAPAPRRPAARTTSEMRRMCSGVEPQQAPTMLQPASSSAG